MFVSDCYQLKILPCGYDLKKINVKERMKTLMKHFLVANGMLQQSLLSNHGKSIKGSVAEIVEGLSL